MVDETLEDFQTQLAKLRQATEVAGFKFCVRWCDEYGGLQSVLLGPSDHIEITAKNRA